MAINEQKKINQKFLFFSIFGRKTKINVKQMKEQKLASKKMSLMLNNSIIFNNYYKPMLFGKYYLLIKLL